MSTIAQGQVLGPIMLKIFINYQDDKAKYTLKIFDYVAGQGGEDNMQRAVQPSRPRKVGEVI